MKSLSKRLVQEILAQLQSNLSVSRGNNSKLMENVTKKALNTYDGTIDPLVV